MELDFDKDIVLEDERVIVSPLNLTHLEALLKVGSQDENLTFYSTFSVYTREDLKKYIEESMAERAAKTRYAFVIFDKQTQQYAGSTSFGNVSNKDQKLEIGWTWIGNDFQRSGLNVHCKFVLLKYIFEVMGFERVELKTDERNLKSREAIEKIGAKFEGILRNHILMRDGFRRSSVYYSILKNEWPDVKSKLEARMQRNANAIK